MTLEPVISEHDVTVYLGDVREVLRELPAGSVNCCVTSPPYYGLRDYGHDGQIGLESSPAEYVEQMRAVFSEVRRVLTDDGVLWLNLGDSYASKPRGNDPHDWSSSGLNGAQTSARYRETLASGTSTKVDTTGFGIAPKNLLGMPWRVAFALQDDGWTLRNAVVWHKPNAMPESVTDRLSTRYELVFLLSKSRRYWFNLDEIREPHITGDRPILPRDFGQRPGQWAFGSGGNHRSSGPEGVGRNDAGRNPGDVWAIPTSPFPGAHFACMPPELARRCILAGCPETGTVLDPFAGSGTTLKVARSLGRKSVGVELNPAYVDIIRDRIGQPTLDFFGEAAS